MLLSHRVAALLLVVGAAVAGTGAHSVGSSKFHVLERNGRYVIADRANRERLIKGINLATLGGGGSDVPIDTDLYTDGKCPPNNDAWYQPPICETDVVELKRRGFDAVRLLVHWSQLEPTPGRYDPSYIRRIDQILEWAESNGVDVLIDFHQDNFANISSFCCADDGAPAWAWLVNETKLTEAEKIEIALLKKVIPQLDWGGAEVAFHAFWTNVLVPSTKIGLQVHYTQAVAALVNATSHRECVLGYELMNEPLPGLDINLFGFAANYLYPFYARIIQAVTGVRDGKPSCPCNITQTNERGLSVACNGGAGAGPVSRDCSYPDLGIHTDKLMVCEPTAVRNQLDVSVQISKPFTTYTNIVYAPHTYTDSFTLWKKEPFSIALDTAVREATAMKSAVLVTEWGGSGLDKLTAIYNEQEKHRVSSTHWVWKQNGAGGWGLHSAVNGKNFTIRMDRLRAVSRIHPRAVAGELLGFHQDNTSFWMQGNCDGEAKGDGNETEIYFPSHFAACATTVRSNGTSTVSSVVSSDDGSKIAHIACTEKGTFAVTCSF